VTQVGERIWLVTFMDYDWGYADDEAIRVEPVENPFGPKVLPMSPAAGINRHPCDRNRHEGDGSSGWIRNRWRRAQRGAALPERQPGEPTTERSEGDGSSGWIRTSNPPVNSRMLYR
jgi:hypothetical protein